MAQRMWNPLLSAVALALLSVAPAAAQSPTAKASLAKARDVCRSDVQKFCKDVAAGGGRIRECLQKNTNQLSPECQQQLARAKQADAQREAGRWAGPCMSDISLLCKDIPPGGGQVRACLERRMQALSEPCRAALQAKKAN